MSHNYSYIQFMARATECSKCCCCKGFTVYAVAVNVIAVGDMALGDADVDDADDARGAISLNYVAAVLMLRCT